ncbi:helix-turn-helix transcriptional regulator [Enterococcus sp.]|jgi:transcriptional regulator with XRE-family HTH domain|uniref:helix-turn-helix domain-containing protein n=1 Tax=Enterococcus sp. TaxID=35783 RepID=UPI0025C54976|nr:helix-turn-helix transcriptional regulator [Enterococcus sp.]
MFAQILKDRRTELGITQQEMAEKLFVTRQTISNWENGKNFPDIPTLISISETYSLSLDYMLKGDPMYMKKVEEDYKLIKKKRSERISHYIVVTSLLLIALICLVIVFLNDYVNENILGTIVILICIPLMGASYVVYKSFYQANGAQPLFIPKAYGIGLTINPNHPMGKVIWLLIGIGLLALLFSSIASI